MSSDAKPANCSWIFVFSGTKPLDCPLRRFTAELLAALLSIPTSKSLLRRHLNIHYKDLVGKEAMKSKREAEQDPNHQVMLEISANTGAALSQKMLLKLQALTPSAKVKPPSLSQGKKPHQFSLGRRTRKSMSPGGPLIGTSKQTVRKIKEYSLRCVSQRFRTVGY